MILGNEIDLTTFLTSFWADFFAGLTLLLIGSFLVPWYLHFRERPKLRLANSINRGSDFKFIESPDNIWRATLSLCIQNRGNKTIERFYWEIFMETDLFDGFDDAMKYPGDKIWYRTVDVDGFLRIYGYIELPIFPLEYLDFPYRLRVKTGRHKPAGIYYYFKTDSGQIPFWGWIADHYKKYHLLKKLNIN